jgi:hypothetical protein
MDARVNFNFYSKSLIVYTVLLLAFVSVFKSFFETIFRTDIFNFADEIIFGLNLIVLAALYSFSRKLKLIYILILVFAIYSVSISLLFGLNKQVLNVVLQTLINIKFFVFLITFLVLFKDRFYLVQTFFKYIIYVSIIGLVIHLIMGSLFNDIIGTPTYARPNIRYTGFLPHPNHLAYLMVLCVGLILNSCKTNNIAIGRINWLKIILALVVIILTDSRTSMIAILIFFIGYYWIIILSNYKLLLGSVLATACMVFSLYFFTDVLDTIAKNIEESLDLNSHYIRGNMIYLSALILFDFLPFGTGAATFGSVLANDEAYALYGQADRYYFVNEIGVYDSNIASIVGEYGILGILFYILIFVALKRHLVNLSFYKNTMINSLIFVFLFFSITNPMITNNVYILLSVPVFMLFVMSNKPQSKKYTIKNLIK